MAKFEEKLKRLEDIVNLLSSPELELEKSLKLFEEGVKLVRELDGELKNAKGKVIEFQKYLEEIEDGEDKVEELEKYEEDIESNDDIPF